MAKKVKKKRPAKAQKKKDQTQDVEPRTINDLTSRQRLFISHYMTLRNATQAAIKAGFSADTANRAGSRLLSNVVIKACIEEREKKVAEKLDLKQEDIIRTLMQIAFFDPMEVLEWDDDRLVFKKDVPDAYMRGANFNIYPEYQNKEDKRDGVVRAKLAISSGDRRGALELLGKTTGLWRDKDAGSGTDKESRANTLKRVRELFSGTRKRGPGDGGSES